MSSTTSSRPSSGQSLREISRDAVRARITEIALELFAERGFEQVTVEQIAAAAGMSARTFHRYFPAKEDVVIGDPARGGEFVRDVLAGRPQDEPVWDSLRIAFEALVSQAPRRGGDDDRGKLAMRVLVSAASLRARSLEKHLLWARMLTPLVAARLPNDDAAFRAEIIVQSALACFDVALTTWANADDGTTASELLERSFATLRPQV
ncbi:TetR family transcriptional regulator [Promicromonospora sp. MEB111]|uniref:TetR family transcriptional regulator n=1 Tax=Promicromonospora sp. MEB111 TaxID=3040301 RepID=UPI00254D1081|nr:TetR family transcriptional regulator [Promicromonospora sp. MEB111]